MRVLLSHTRELREHPAGHSFVAAAERAVLRAGMTVSDMAYFAARDTAPPEVCVAAVAEADILVGLLGLRYGSLADGKVSYTELEFDTATRRGLPRLMFLLDTQAPNLPLPPAEMIDRELGKRQDAFRDKVLAAGLVAGSFGTPDQLEKLIFQALIEHERRRGTSAPPRRRSRYLAQVRDIAPRGGVRDREAELAELTAWCAGDEAYVWWQAPPWSGKSSLMAAFVLDPPPGIEVVAFFVTARLSGQSDSTAYTDALLEQLTAFLGEELPAALLPSAMDTYRRDLLAQAADRAHEQGKRLVLIVDGLDEDTGGPGLSSIASLLPKHLPDGLRVIVAGRPNPGLPDDVPPDHPLRACRVRELAASRHAAEVERSARWELDRLLGRDDRHRDVIGLITAAGGGLTGRELQELTGLGAFDIEGMLAGECGRTMASRLDTSLLSPRRVYLFAHDTLRTAAIERLGVLLEGYRGRLHEWVGGYRRQGWPATTPAYALSGYFPMLVEVGDATRALESAVDPARHHRSLAATGGDAGALTEIGIAERTSLAAAEPDLVAMARLNVHRTAIADRNAQIPPALPAVWARLGNPVRAEALARAITDPATRAEALAAVATELLQRGDRDRAWSLVAGAEASARTAVPAFYRDDALRALADRVAAAGDLGRAQAIAEGITTPGGRVRALVGLVRAVRDAGFTRAVLAAARRVADSGDDRPELLAGLAQVSMLAGDFAGAEAAATGIADERIRAAQLGDVATTLAADGRPGDAEALARRITDDPVRAAVLIRLAAATRDDRLADEAETIWDTVTDPMMRAETGTALLAVRGRAAAARLRSPVENAIDAIAQPDHRGVQRDELIRVLFRAGDRLGAEAVATAPLDPTERAMALAELPGLIAEEGDLDRAERKARGIEGADWQDWALDRVALVAARAGRYDRAEALARDNTGAARPRCLRQIVECAVAAGDHHRALVVAGAIDVPEVKAEALAMIAGALAATGDPVAEELAAEAETTARAAVDPAEQDWAWGQLAAACESRGDHERAEEIAALVESRNELLALFDATVRNGRFDRAEAIARDIDELAEEERVREPRQVGAAALPETAPVAWRLARDHTPDAAERIVSRISAPLPRVQALGRLAAMAAAAGDRRRAAAAATTAWAVTREIDNADDRAQASVAAATAMTLAGEDGPAEAILRGIADPARPDPARHDQALRGMAEALAGRGEHDRAEALARAITDRAERDRVLAEIARSLAEAGRSADAEALARGITVAYQRARGLILVAMAARTADPGRVARLCREAMAATADPVNADGWNSSHLIRLMAQAGEGGLAETTARAIADPVEREYALGELAMIAADRGDFDRAESFLGDLDDGGAKDDALQRLAERLAAAGALDRAEETADRMAFPEERAETLVRIAAAATWDRPRVARLLARAFHLSPWPNTIVAMAGIAPEVVRAVDQQLAGELGGQVTAR